jgi:hypothetical protein
VKKEKRGEKKRGEKKRGEKKRKKGKEEKGTTFCLIGSFKLGFGYWCSF